MPSKIFFLYSSLISFLLKNLTRHAKAAFALAILVVMASESRRLPENTRPR